MRFIYVANVWTWSWLKLTDITETQYLSEGTTVRADASAPIADNIGRRLHVSCSTSIPESNCGTTARRQPQALWLLISLDFRLSKNLSVRSNPSAAVVMNLVQSAAWLRARFTVFL